MSDSLIIIPTYNEEENIEKLIKQIFSFEKEFHVLVVDDRSPDKTSQIIKQLQEEFPKKLFLEAISLKCIGDPPSPPLFSFLVSVFLIHSNSLE